MTALRWRRAADRAWPSNPVPVTQRAFSRIMNLLFCLKPRGPIPGAPSHGSRSPWQKRWNPGSIPSPVHVSWPVSDNTTCQDLSARDERSAQDMTSGLLKIRELIGLTRVF
jgi:hypothetical protein